jgi:uncharacterized membrane protein YgdD (TMEM256/DUF423 family)
MLTAKETDMHRASVAKKICAIGAFCIAIGVMIGAFGAHGLRDVLDERGRAIYEKAVLYHFISAIGILAVGICGEVGLMTQRKLGWIAGLLVAGILFFSGSLYLLAITQLRWLGMITPIGGLSLIIGWALFAWACWENGERSS